jgi:hypothetical protein
MIYTFSTNGRTLSIKPSFIILFSQHNKKNTECKIHRQFMFVKEGIIEHYVQSLIYAKNRYLDM